MNTGLFERLHDLGEYLDSERQASGQLQAQARQEVKPRSRRTVIAAAAVAVAAAIVAVVLASQSPPSHPGVVWAANPDRVTPNTSNQADTACRGASSITLPAMSSLDLRGDVGVVLYEMKPAWQICTFARHGNGVSTVQVTAVSAPALDPSVPQETTTLASALPVNVTINDTRIMVMAGKFTGICSSNCFDTVHLHTDAGQGQAPLSPTGTFVIWVPAGTTSRVSLSISR